MKKTLLIIFIFILLVGCSQDEFSVYRNEYIEEQGITNIEEIMVYEDQPNIRGIIFKGITDGTKENLYYYEGLPGKSSSLFSNGEYTGSLLQIDEGMTYTVYEGEDFGYDKSYFIGIVYRKITAVYYKDESIDFKTADVDLNDKGITLSVWLMPFNNGERINVDDFDFKE